MKILIFNWRDIKNPRSGGAEILTHQMAKGWVQKGHKVVLFSSQFKDAKKKEILDDIEIIRAGNSLSVYWQAYRYYKRFFRGHFDVIIDEINTIPFFTNLYVKEPVICHINQLAREVWLYESFFPLSIIGYIAESFYLKTYRNNYVITISESTKEDLLNLGFKKDRVFIIPMGINFKPLEAVRDKEKSPTLIYVGRLKKSKRVDHIISAFKLARREFANCKLWIVGDGDRLYKKKLYHMARNVPNIEFFHKLNDKDKLDLMKRAQAIIVTSIKEGWGLIVTEANAMATPAIAYNVSGLRDSIKDRITGLLCKKNNPQTLSDTIVDFFKNRKLREDLTQNALKSSKKFNWRKTTIESLNFLEQVLETRIKRQQKN